VRRCARPGCWQDAEPDGEECYYHVKRAVRLISEAPGDLELKQRRIHELDRLIARAVAAEQDDEGGTIMSDEEGFEIQGLELGVGASDQAKAAVKDTLKTHGLRFVGQAVVTPEQVEAGGPELLQHIGTLAARAMRDGHILTLLAFKVAGGYVAPIFVEVEGHDG
jgi:hypothetical protein